MEVMVSKAISTAIKGSWPGFLIFCPGKCLEEEGEVEPSSNARESSDFTVLLSVLQDREHAELQA